MMYNLVLNLSYQYDYKGLVCKYASVSTYTNKG
jgi:hypothetical protein